MLSKPSNGSHGHEHAVQCVGQGILAGNRADIADHRADHPSGAADPTIDRGKPGAGCAELCLCQNAKAS